MLRKALRKMMKRLRPGTRQDAGLRRRVRNLELAVDAIVDGFEYRASASIGFNGQTGRKRIFDELVSTCGFDAILETGTWIANTTGYMAERTGLPVHSCEVDERFSRIAMRRMQSFQNVRVYLEHSGAMPTRLAASGQCSGTVFCDLDAHWYGDAPLVAELEIIAAHWPNYVVMIDDFAVPGDSGYGYDAYAEGQQLCMPLIGPVVTAHQMSVFYPTLASSQETGKRRGCVVLASPGEMTDRVRMAATLRSAS